MTGVRRQDYPQRVPRHKLQGRRGGPIPGIAGPADPGGLDLRAAENFGFQWPRAGGPRAWTRAAAKRPVSGGMAREESSLRAVKRLPIMGISNIRMR